MSVTGLIGTNHSDFRPGDFFFFAPIFALMSRGRELSFEERRAHERVYRQVPVRFDAGDGERTAFANDISEGGLHLVTNEVTRVGARLRIEVELDEESTQHECEVMWAIRVPEHLTESMVYGMGLRFLHPPAGWSLRFRRWKESLDGSA
jgi:hypothetical protein